MSYYHCFAFDGKKPCFSENVKKMTKVESKGTNNLLWITMSIYS